MQQKNQLPINPASSLFSMVCLIRARTRTLL